MTPTANEARTVTVFLPVADVDGLRAAVAGLPRGEASVFARGRGTHVARFIVLDDFVPQPGAGGRPDHLSVPYLLFSAVVDVPAGRAGDLLGFYLPTLLADAGGELEPVFARCEGCPGTADADAFVRWMRSHELPAALEVMADRTASAREIVAALERRARVKELAVRLRGASAAEIRRACEEAFPELAKGSR